MLLLWLGIFSLLPRAGSEETLSVNAVCSAEACYTAHLDRKSFNGAWRSCRDHGGNLATIKKREEASLVKELLSGLLLGDRQGPFKLWLGLQRQPRQCSSYKALRGFTWTTGDQDTQYTNWLKEEYPGSCPATRCVVLSYGTGEASRYANHKWLDGSCQLAVDGYLCRFAYKGMCPPIELGFGEPVVYATPFGVTLTHLRHVPFGSVATVPCGGPRGAQSLLCMLRREEEDEEGAVRWSRDGPLCQGAPRRGWCTGNGGCQHVCVDEGAYYHCQCDPGYQLAEDGRDCLDVDECPYAPCEQSCVNTPGAYYCQCFEGYQLEEGECRDLDECEGTPCDQLCANTQGSFQCYCEVGFTLSQGDAHTCTDVDECQYHGTCHHMCVNYLGHFECHCDQGYTLDHDGFSCTPEERATPDGFERDFKAHLTQAPNWETVPSTRGQTGEENRQVEGWPGVVTRRAEETGGQEGSVTTPSLPEAPPERKGHSTVRAETWTSNPRGLEYSSPVTEPPGARITSGEPEGARASEGARDRISVSEVPEGREPVKPGAPEWRAGKVVEQPWVESPAPTILSRTAPAAGGHRGSTRAPARLTVNASRGPGAHRDSRQSRDDRWLLVALLVPICIFVVVVLAFAIVCCTRCACGRSREVTDCYRWVNSSTKSAVPDATSTNMNTTVWDPHSTEPATTVWRTDVTHV
ncbi:endosialin-like isoform X2 [Heptranchias perlo]|uniref:endosialin-like isoform X2 n=1 Tax=Heptranchias perlo TaxID=212740 RepID=UPI003559E6DF